MSKVISASFTSRKTPGTADFRDETEARENEQAAFLASLEDDSTIIAGPAEWFKNSAWGAPAWGTVGYRYRRTLEREAYHEQQSSIRSIAPGMFGMAGDYLAREVTKYLGGEWHGNYGKAPSPGHSKAGSFADISAARERSQRCDFAFVRGRRLEGHQG